MLNGRIGLIAVISTVLAGNISGATFNFDNIPSQPTPVSDIEGGITATFTAVVDRPSAEPAGFVGGPGEITSQGIDPNGEGQDVAIGFGNYLDITFDRDVNIASVDFQVFDFGGFGFFSIDAFENANPVGNAELDGGVNIDGHFGEIEFEGANLNEIHLEDVNHPFAIDNLDVNAVPEPATSGLCLITGCALLSLGLRQSRLSPSR